MYKSQYRKRKKVNGIFLEALVEPDFASDVGKIVPILHIHYKLIYNKKTRIEIDIYDTDNFSISIKSDNCRFYKDVSSEYGEGIYSENLREFWFYLHYFENDLRDRLHDMYIYFRDEMPKECRDLFEEILNKL